MRRYLAIGLAAVLVCGTACLQDPDPILFIGSLTEEPPDTTYEATVKLSGRVVRTPPTANALLIVTVTGGVIPVSDTASLVGGLFDITIPLTTNADNDLEATASDGLGSPTPNPWRKTVTQIDTTGAPRTGND
jgi:hypothetical protein